MATDPTVFGRRLRYYRTLIGLTLEQLSEKADITLHTLHRYENGSRYPQIDVAARLAEILEIKIDALLDPDGPEPDRPAPTPRSTGKRK